MLVAKFFNIFCQIYIIVPIIVIGFLFKDRKSFLEALLVLLFASIFAASLKAIFKVPLAAHVGKGYAWPSGHMMVSTMFYGWLFIRYRQPLIIPIIIGIGYSVIALGYHSLSDVIGALCFSIPSLYFFYKMNFSLRNLSIFVSICTVSMMIFLYYYDNLPPHLFANLYIIAGISLIRIKQHIFPLKDNIYAAVIYIILSSVIIYLFSLPNNLPILIYNIKYFLVAALLPLSLKYRNIYEKTSA